MTFAAAIALIARLLRGVVLSIVAERLVAVVVLLINSIFPRGRHR